MSVIKPQKQLYVIQCSQPDRTTRVFLIVTAFIVIDSNNVLISPLRKFRITGNMVIIVVLITPIIL